MSRVLLAAWLAVGANAFAPSPIKWSGDDVRSFVLLPKAVLNKAKVPQDLTIRDRLSILSSSAIPHFKAQVDSTITWEDSGFCLEATGKKAGDKVHINRCTGAADQKWKSMPNAYGHGTIQLMDTKICLGVNPEEGALSGATVELQNCDDELAQAWMFDGAFSTPNGLAPSFTIRHAMIASAGLAVLVMLSIWLLLRPRNSYVPTAAQELLASQQLATKTNGGGDATNRRIERANIVQMMAETSTETDIQRKTGDNVEQIKNTQRDKVMTFSYDMSVDTGYEKPTYKGTGNGLGGDQLEDEYDIIVIGSGMGGLACGSLSQEYGSKVAVLESHIKPGGSAHTFTRMHKGGKYSFEVGPSIFEGLNGPSLNPLRTILDMLGEDLKCETYTGLGYWTPEGYWRFPIGSAQKFEDLIYERCGKEEGDKAVKEWAALRARLKTLGGSTMAVSLVNLRQDAGMIATTAGATPYVLTHPNIFLDLPLTFDSLHKTVDQIITVPFLRNYIDTMCIFCGFPAKGAMTAHILYILERFFEDGCTFCVPLGGTVEMAYAFQRALEKRGGTLSLNTHVAEIIYDKELQRCTGVKLKNGRVIKAKKAVVSNATPFDTVRMLPDGGDAPDLPEGVREWKTTLGKLPRHGAIMHLFLAIDATDLDLSHIDDPAHLVVQDWGRSLQDSQNLCSFFIPSLRDPSVCPEGKHCIHVYSSGGEPYEPWENFEPGSAEYEKYKEERAEVLWRAVERCIPDVRSRVEFSIIGSPLAHEAFLRRDRGTYGLAWAAGTSAPFAGQLSNVLPFPFPNLKTPVDGLLRCGDSCFPGIGTPSAAASGAIAANTMHSVSEQIRVLKATAKREPKYDFLDPGPIGSVYEAAVGWSTPSQELRGKVAAEAP